MTISRGQMPRQMYGLGSFVKSIGKGVKSAVSGVKDFVKSDVGKAALLTAGGFGLAGMGPLKGLAGLLPVKGAGKFPFSPVQGSGSFFGGLVDKFSNMGNIGKAATVFGIGSLGGGALAALEAAGLDTSNPNEMPRDVESIKSYLRQGYRQLNPEAGNDEIEAFVEANTTEYRANGGRIGYADGMNDPSDLPRGLQIDTTTRNPIPENALQEEIESVVRIMMGPGSAGIGEPEDGTMKGYQFFRKQYLPKKIKELSENFGYSEDEIYKMLNLKVREFKESPELLQKPKMAMGGRIGFAGGTEFEEYLKGKEKFDKQQNYEQLYREFLENKRRQKVAEQKTMAANGGRIGYAFGNDPEQNAVEASGIMNLPLNQNPAGATELDLRETGGFIPPVGVKEKEDDIPAMLSNNEFVFTADAVRGMGDGDVNKGAQRMYDMMKKLEGGGRV
jgi:hypothetical protein